MCSGDSVYEIEANETYLSCTQYQFDVMQACAYFTVYVIHIYQKMSS